MIKTMIKDKPLFIVLFFLSLIGSIFSFILLHERILLWQNDDYMTACDINAIISCGNVMESWQASTFGFPNILIGTTLFPMLTLITIIGFLNQFNQKIWYLIELGTSFAFAFVIWLYYSAVFSLQILCPYCMVIWAITIPISVIVFTRNRLFENKSKRLAQFLKNWWWVIIVLMYTIIISTILVKLFL